MMCWRRITPVVMLLLAAVSVEVMSPRGAHGATIVKISGAGAGLGTMKVLAEAYMKSHPDVTVKVFPNIGSAGGIKAVTEGGLELAIAARPLNDNERKPGVVAQVYARTPLAFITHPRVAKKDITLHELEQIYGGSMQSWPDDTRIRPILRPQADIDTSIIQGMSPGMGPAMKAARSRRGLTVAVTDQECAATVAKVPGALGANTLSEILTDKPAVKVLSYNGVQPTVAAMVNGSYPLFKTLYIVTTPATPLAARRFVEFVRSPAGRKMLEQYGNQALP